MGCSLMGRIYGNAGTAITQATISSISYKVYEHTTKPLAETATENVTFAVGCPGVMTLV